MILVTVLLPIEVAAVHDNTAYLHRMAIHVLGGGMGNDIRTPLKWSAVHRSGEGIVHDQRYAVLVRHISKFLDVQDHQCRIRNGFRDHNFCVRLECCRDFFRRCIRVHKGTLNAQLLEGYRQQIEGSAVQCGRCHDVVAGFADVKNSIEICGLSGGSHDSGNAAFHVRNLCRYSIVGRILKAGVEVAFCLQVKKLSHFIRRIILKCGALVNWQGTRLPLRRSISGMDTLGF